MKKKLITLIPTLITTASLTSPAPMLILLALLMAGVSFPPVFLILVALAPFFTEESGLVPF